MLTEREAGDWIVVSYARQPESQRLDQGPRQPLPQRCQNEHITRAVQIRYVAGLDAANAVAISAQAVGRQGPDSGGLRLLLAHQKQERPWLREHRYLLDQAVQPLMVPVERRDAQNHWAVMR